MKGLPEMGLWREDERILRLFVAETWWTRARGLLGRPRLAPDQGLWIAPCASVHGLGMGYTLSMSFFWMPRNASAAVPGCNPGGWRCAATPPLPSR